MKSAFSILDGIVLGAAQISSPNFNARPIGSDGVIAGIVIHNISLPPSQFGQMNRDGIHHIKAFFQNQLNPEDHPYFKQIHEMQVSAHLFIERDGTVTQFVNLDDRAWHAGNSHFLGRRDCNDFTIGIELEGDDFSAFEPAQYEALSQIIAAIYDAYPQTRRHLMGHSDIAPSRKTDPGEFFDWQLIRQLVAELMAKSTKKHAVKTD